MGTRIPMIESGRNYELRLRAAADAILTSLLSVLPSEYRSSVPSTDYGVYLRAISRELARIRLAIDGIEQDLDPETLRPEFLWQFLAGRLFRDGRLPEVGNGSAEEFADFLVHVLQAVYKGSTPAALRDLLALLVLDGTVTVKEPALETGDIENGGEFGFLVEIEATGGGFIDHPVEVSQAIGILMDILRPAHTLYVITHVLRETVPSPSSDALRSIVGSWYRYEDTRKLWEGLYGTDRLGMQRVRAVTGEVHVGNGTATYAMDHGPLVLRTGARVAHLATDVSVLNGAVPVPVDHVDGMQARVVLTAPVPATDTLTFTYYWMEWIEVGFARLNDSEFVLNAAFDGMYTPHRCFLPGADDVAFDLSGYGLANVVGIGDPVEVYHEYQGVLHEGSSLLNSPTTLVTNISPRHPETFPANLAPAVNENYTADALPVAPWEVVHPGTAGTVSVGGGVLTINDASGRTVDHARTWRWVLPGGPFQGSATVRVRVPSSVPDGVYTGISLLVTDGYRAGIVDLGRNRPAVFLGGTESNGTSWRESGLTSVVDSYRTFRLDWEDGVGVSLYVEGRDAPEVVVAWADLPAPTELEAIGALPESVPCVMFGAFDRAAASTTEWQFVRVNAFPLGITSGTFTRTNWGLGVAPGSAAPPWSLTNGWGVPPTDTSTALYSVARSASGAAGPLAVYLDDELLGQTDSTLVETFVRLDAFGSGADPTTLLRIDDGRSAVEVVVGDDVSYRSSWTADDGPPGAPWLTSGTGTATEMGEELLVAATNLAPLSWTQPIDPMTDWGAFVHCEFPGHVWGGADPGTILRVRDGTYDLSVYLEDLGATGRAHLRSNGVTVAQVDMDWRAFHTYEIRCAPSVSLDLYLIVDGDLSVFGVYGAAVPHPDPTVQIGLPGPSGTAVEGLRLFGIARTVATSRVGLRTDSGVLWADLPGGDVAVATSGSWRVSSDASEGVSVNVNAVDLTFGGNVYANRALLPASSGRPHVAVGGLDEGGVLLARFAYVGMLTYRGEVLGVSEHPHALNAVVLAPSPSHAVTVTEAHSHPVTEAYLESLADRGMTWTVLEEDTPIVPYRQVGVEIQTPEILDTTADPTAVGPGEYSYIVGRTRWIVSFGGGALYEVLSEFVGQSEGLSNQIATPWDRGRVAGYDLDYFEDTYVLPAEVIPAGAFLILGGGGIGGGLLGTALLGPEVDSPVSLAMAWGWGLGSLPVYPGLSETTTTIVDDAPTVILTRVFAVEANSLLNDVAAILDDGTGYGPAGVDARIIVGLNDEPEILLVGSPEFSPGSLLNTFVLNGNSTGVPVGGYSMPVL